MIRKILLGAVAAAGAMALASSASAATLLVSDVGVYNWNTVDVPGHGPSEVATGIIFNNDLLVFCVDIEHNIGVTHYSPPLVFTLGLLEFDGAGGAIDAVTSNRIGHLAYIGQQMKVSGDPDFKDDLSAIQAAIWSLEYGVTATSADAEINAEIQSDLALAQTFHGTTRATALIAHGPHEGGTQNMVTGGVPEPASWALMIGGFGLAGAALRRRRTSIATA